MSDCLFCKIADRSISADVVFEDDRSLVFQDVHPKSPTHLLIIPKKHIASVIELEDDDRDLMGHLLLVARKVAKDLGLEGYKLQINVGEHGGQEVFHLHIHLLSKFS